MFEINQTMRVNPNPHRERRLPRHDDHPLEEEMSVEQQPLTESPPHLEPDKGLRLDIRI